MPHPDDLSDEEADLLNITREDPEAVAEAERERQIEVSFRREFLVSMMQNRTFRAWLIEILAEFGTFGHSFGASPTGVPDPLATWFALGMKAAGWRLWEIFDGATPELASLMRREASVTKEEARSLAPPPPVARLRPEQPPTLIDG